MMRSPSRTSLRRSTPWVDGCCGPMLSTMSVLSAAPPMPTVVSVVGVMRTVSPTYAYLMETGSPHDTGPAGSVGTAGAAEGEPAWTGLPPGLLRMRRLLLMVWLGLLAVGLAVLLSLTAGPAWAAFALLPLALAAWGWVLLGRNWRSWRYAERADDLLISRGVLWREET